jgi:hypothetical protein
MAAKDATCALLTRLAAIHMTGAALAKCGGSRAEERSFVEYALHGENDIAVARLRPCLWS